VLFDTDVLIWIQRGSLAAARVVDSDPDPAMAIFGYLELLQGATDKAQQRAVRSFLREVGFRILPLTEAIGRRATVYMEEHALSHGLRAGDALVAATATEHALPLCTSNAKHFRPIKDLELKVLKP
jgi:predicted nucleic acid-binding protein